MQHAETGNRIAGDISINRTTNSTQQHNTDKGTTIKSQAHQNIQIEIQY